MTENILYILNHIPHASAIIMTALIAHLWIGDAITQKRKRERDKLERERKRQDKLNKEREEIIEERENKRQAT